MCCVISLMQRYTFILNKQIIFSRNAKKTGKFPSRSPHLLMDLIVECNQL